MLHHFHCDEFFIILNHKLHCCNFWTLPPLLLLSSRKSLAPSTPYHQAAEDCNKILLEPSLLKAEQTQCIADMFNSSGPQVLSCKATFYPISLQGSLLRLFCPRCNACICWTLFLSRVSVISPSLVSSANVWGHALCHSVQVINRVDRDC